VRRDEPERVVDRGADVAVGRREQAGDADRAAQSILTQASDDDLSSWQPTLSILVVFALKESVQRGRQCRKAAYDADGPWKGLLMDTARRGNYNSGEDFVLEYGELRFTFNEADFRERCEQAAVRLGFIGDRLDDPELEDLVNLAVNGEILDPASALGAHVNDCWPAIVGPAERSMVHWLRRLVFRGAWLDQRVREGELDVAFCEHTNSFSYVQPDRGGEPIELAPEPSWGRVAYRAS
jgi:hypothetical protein